MRTTKKILSIIISVTMLACIFAGCGKKEEVSNASDTVTTGAKTEETESTEEEAPAEEEKQEEAAKIPGHYDLWSMSMKSVDG